MKIQCIRTNNYQKQNNYLHQNNCQKQPNFTSVNTYIKLRGEKPTFLEQLWASACDTGPFKAMVKHILEPFTDQKGRTILPVYDPDSHETHEIRVLVFDISPKELMKKIERAYLCNNKFLEFDLTEHCIDSQRSYIAPYDGGKALQPFWLYKKWHGEDLSSAELGYKRQYNSWLSNKNISEGSAGSTANRNSGFWNEEEVQASFREMSAEIQASHRSSENWGAYERGNTYPDRIEPYVPDIWGNSTGKSTSYGNGWRIPDGDVDMTCPPWMRPSHDQNHY